MDEDGAVKVDVQVAEELWDTYTDPAKDTLRIKYDPFDDRNWVLPASAVGPGISKLMTVAITILGGLSLGELEDFGKFWRSVGDLGRGWGGF